MAFAQFGVTFDNNYSNKLWRSLMANTKDKFKEKFDKGE
jgi:hypothetical protein